MPNGTRPIATLMLVGFLALAPGCLRPRVSGTTAGRSWVELAIGKPNDPVSKPIKFEGHSTPMGSQVLFFSQRQEEHRKTRLVTTHTVAMMLDRATNSGCLIATRQAPQGPLFLAMYRLPLQPAKRRGQDTLHIEALASLAGTELSPNQVRGTAVPLTVHLAPSTEGPPEPAWIADQSKALARAIRTHAQNLLTANRLHYADGQAWSQPDRDRLRQVLRERLPQIEDLADQMHAAHPAPAPLGNTPP